MTTYAKGADVRALRGNIDRLKSLRGELKGIEGASRSAMSTIEGNWGGENLLALLRHFNGTAVPSLHSLDSAIDSMTTALIRNANAQDLASGGDGNLFPPEAGENKTFRGTKVGGSAHTWSDPRRKSWLTNDEQGSKQKVPSQPTSSYQAEHGDHGYTKTTGRGGSETEVHERTKQVPHAGGKKTETLSDEERYSRKGQLHEVKTGYQTASEKEVNRPYLPKSEDTAKERAEQEKWDKDNPGKAALRDAAKGAVNITEKDEKTYGHDWKKDPNAVMALSGSTHTEVGIKDGAAYAGAGAAASAMLAKGGTGTGPQSFAGGTGEAKLSGSVGAAASVDAGATWDGKNAKAEVNAHVEAAARGEASASYSNGPIEAAAKVNAMAGAEANANASAAIGADGAKVHAGVDAFAGAKAGAEVSGSVAGVGATVGGEVYAGIGAHAKVDAAFSAEKVKVDVDVGAAIGIGGGVKFSIDVNPAKTISDLGLSDEVEAAQRTLVSHLPKIF